MLEWSTVEAIDLPRYVMKRYLIDQQDFRLIFISLKKVCGRFHRDILWKPKKKWSEFPIFEKFMICMKGS